MIFLLIFEGDAMILAPNSINSISVFMFPDGRLDTKNAARYLGLKREHISHDALEEKRSTFYQTMSDFLF